MSLKVLGVSGSPIENSNTDRAVKAILKASNLKSEFVKLSEIDVKPCDACKRCVGDNICKVDDDFPPLAEKIRKAEALVIGAYSPYSQIDAYTKAFLERLWSMRHVNNINEGKLVVTVVTGVAPAPTTRVRKVMLKLLKRTIKKHLPLYQISRAIAREMRMENMNVIGNITIRGNLPCLTCGEGSTCKMSGIPSAFGKSVKASKNLCVRVEDQPEVWKEVIRLGNLLHDFLH